jgi:hypothetical protein
MEQKLKKYPPYSSIVTERLNQVKAVTIFVSFLKGHLLWAATGVLYVLGSQCSGLPFSIEF